MGILEGEKVEQVDNLKTEHPELLTMTVRMMKAETVIEKSPENEPEKEKESIFSHSIFCGLASLSAMLGLVSITGLPAVILKVILGTTDTGSCLALWAYTMIGPLLASVPLFVFGGIEVLIRGRYLKSAITSVVVIILVVAMAWYGISKEVAYRQTHHSCVACGRDFPVEQMITIELKPKNGELRWVCYSCSWQRNRVFY
jgi:hypothetical protein